MFALNALTLLCLLCAALQSRFSLRVRMGQSRLSWAVGVIAPWCLGLGVMVSFTAEAGQDAGIGASIAARSFGVTAPPLDLIPSIASMRQSFGLSQPTKMRVRLASLQLGDKADLIATPDEIEPRRELKIGAKAFPVVDRSRRGDPVIGLRPTLDTRLRKSGGIDAYRATELALSPNGALAFDGFSPSDGPVPGPDSVSFFEPPEPIQPAPAQTSGDSAGPSTPGAVANGTTTRPVLRGNFGDRGAVYDGATPATPRAVALASATPTPADKPVNATALLGPHGADKAPVMAKHGDQAAAQASIVPRAQRPDYASLVDPSHEAKEEFCLAQAIYFEARSEPEAGQAAVAQVVLNRVSSGLYPPSICGVVFQNAQRYKACQFSFACEGRSLRVTEAAPWAAARRIARDVLQGRTYDEQVGMATHYHADYVRPGWSRRLKKTDKIGQHIFYKLRPGQT
jgi:spore germination cell wall hydrolase CwlJ-like protein